MKSYNSYVFLVPWRGKQKRPGKPLLQSSWEEYQRVINNYLFYHFFLVKCVLVGQFVEYFFTGFTS